MTHITVKANEGVYHAKTAIYNNDYLGGVHTIHVEVFESDMTTLPMVSIRMHSLYGQRVSITFQGLEDLKHICDGLTEILNEFEKE